MKYLKQAIVFIIVVVILFHLVPRNNIKKENKNIKEITSYYLTYNNVDILLNNNFNNYIAVLGPYNDLRESDSEYPGKLYFYDNFQIETYYDGNVEKIKTIQFTSDNIYTNEGLALGDQEQYITNTYNQATFYKDNVYRYELNGTCLTFIVSDNKIISIQYSII